MDGTNRPYAMPPTAVVQAKHIYKIYERHGLEIKALEDVSLEVFPGEFLALMGPSGSGKTTLLNLVAGIDRQSTGDLFVSGQHLCDLNEQQAAWWRHLHIGYIFQTFSLIPVLTALENVELPLLLAKLDAQQRHEHARTALKLVGLEDRIEHLPWQLSGGQQQRVAIARAVVSDATLLLADEPTGDLDRGSATEVLELLKRLNQDFHKTIIMVTHDPYAASYAHTTKYLEKGRLLTPLLEKVDRSYRSQHGQDRFLDQVVFKEKNNGTFIEIGACDGLFLSNTYFFEKERKWTGICIEPRKSQFDELCRNRSCTCLNLCVTSAPGEEQFTEFTGVWMPGLSGLEKNFHTEHRKTIALGMSGQHQAERYRVKTDNLTNILQAQSLTHVDYCSIDVEGSEMEILAGIDFQAVNIQAFSIENNYSNPEITAFMQKRGYRLIQEIGVPREALDQIYVKNGAI